MNIKSLISTVAIVAGMSTVAPAANAFEFGDIEWSGTADYTSEYIFRGTTLGADSTQFGLEGAIGDFYFGGWTSNGFGEAGTFADDELDLYAGYGFTLSDLISADVGATIYYYPQLGDLFEFGDNLGGGDSSTLELFGGLAFDTFLDPSVYVYYDVDLENFTAEASGGYSWPVANKLSFDVAGTIGLVDSDAGTDYEYLSLGGALSYEVSDDTSAYVGINGGYSSEDTFTDVDDVNDLSFGNAEDSSFWFGAGISTDF